jgi:hypothetical protein
VKRIFNTFLIGAVVLFLTSTPVLFGGQDNQAVLERIDIQQTPEFLKAAISITGEFGYQHFELNNPSRLVVEIAPVGEMRTEESYDVNAFGVNAVRTGRFKPDTARIVFDFGEIPPSYEVIQVANGIEVAFRQVVTVDRVPSVPEKTEVQEEIPQEELRKEGHLKTISYGKREDQLKVDIHIDGDFFYRTVELRSLSQLVFEIWPISILSAESLRNINLSGLKEITVQKTGPETVRVVFNFSWMLSSFKIDRRDNGLSILFHPVEEQIVGPAGVRPRKKVIYEPIENSAVTLSFGPYAVSDQIYNQIYSGNKLMFGFELSRIFARSDNNNFGVVFGANYYKDTGSSTLTREESTFRLIPYYLCFEYLINQDEVIPFLRLGINIMSYREKSELHEVSGSTVGPNIALGIYIKIPELKQLRLKFYFMWIGATAEEGDESIKIGGIEAGIGVTFGFNLF